MSNTTNLGNLAIPVGTYTSQGQDRKRWRNIGTLFKTSEAGEDRLWLKLNADILHASLFALVRGTGMDKGDDTFTARVFPPRDKTSAPPAGGAPAEAPGDDDIPF